MYIIDCRFWKTCDMQQAQSNLWIGFYNMLVDVVLVAVVVERKRGNAQLARIASYTHYIYTYDNC